MKILTTKFNTKYDTAFKIKNEDFPCFIEGIALAKAEIDAKRRGIYKTPLKL
jgi:hypothetical protein